MSFQNPIKLGRPRKELSFTATIDEIDSLRIPWRNDEARIRNSAGEQFRRVFRRSSPNFSIMVPSATEATVQKIMGLRLIDDEPLSFYFASALKIHSERYLTTGLASLILDSSPMTRLGKAYVDAGGTHSDIIAIQGVFTTYDVGGAQGGTNYFLPTGTYNAQTRVVTLDSSPGPIGTVVYVNWSYNGALVMMGNPALSHKGGDVSGTPLWDVSVELEGA
jgi:hypothetical protein